MNDDKKDKHGIDRRDFLKASAGTAGGLLLGGGLGVSRLARAADYPAIGNFPAGVAGSSVFVGIAVPRTGPYSAQGEDEIKGYQLAIDHLNNGTSLAKAYAPHTRKGVLGKKIEYGIADNQTKPNVAVQAISKFLSDHKAMMITGSVSSAVAIASGKLCDREKTIYLPAITGSNATTGKDCQRYSFRACHFAYTASKALAPVIKNAIGPNKKVAYLTPDYTYGHSVYNSMKEFTEAQGWTTANNQLPPLGTSDFSTYLLNIGNSGADVLVNICFGRDAVISTKQAQQFGLLDRMTLVMPYMAPFFAQEVGADLLQGVYGTTEFWWTTSTSATAANPAGRPISPSCRPCCGPGPSAPPIPSIRRQWSRSTRRATPSTPASAKSIGAPTTTSWCGRCSSSAARSLPTCATRKTSTTSSKPFPART
jgi:branched-chain amino acid transport system substrate-binding protein